MRTLITGANGYLGNHLADSLLQKGHDVSALILEGTDISSLENKPVRIFPGDIRDQTCIENAMEGCETVYHLASLVGLWHQDRSLFNEINVKGTRNVLEASLKKGVKRVLIVSSCGIFGPSQRGELIDETGGVFSSLTDPYEISKYHQVRAGLHYRRKGLEVVFAYPTRVFGPGIESEGNSLTAILNGVVGGTWRLILGSGRNVANYVFVNDVIKGMELIMEKGKDGEGYILGGYNLTYNELFEKLQQLSGKQSRLFRVPYPVLHFLGRLEEWRAGRTGKKPFITAHAAKKYTSDWWVSTRKIREELGYRPTPFEKSLRLTLGLPVRTEARKTKAPHAEEIVNAW